MKTENRKRMDDRAGVFVANGLDIDGKTDQLAVESGSALMLCTDRLNIGQDRFVMPFFIPQNCLFSYPSVYIFFAIVASKNQLFCL